MTIYGIIAAIYTIKSRMYINDKTNITARSHFGDLQFIHAMASVDREDPEETLAKIMLWAEFTYNVAINSSTFASKKLSEISFKSKERKRDKWYSFTDFFITNADPAPDTTVTDLFKRDSQYPNIMVDRRALGSLLHMIQDSYAKGHIERELLNPGDLKYAPEMWFAPRTWGKFGSIITFHTYVGQDDDQHAKWDYVGTTGMDPKKIESFNRAIGGRDAIAHSVEIVKFWMKKTPWDAKDGPKDYLLKNVFALHDGVRPADGKM